MPKPDSITRLLASARAGDVQAMYEVGEAYANGTLVRKDDAQALYWYRQAAQASHADATSNVGKMYFSGRGVPQNDEEALEWIQKAVSLGSIKAFGNMGVLYHLGRGVAKDPQEAIKWYNVGAEKGDVHSMRNLGQIYRDRGEAEVAVPWLEKAAALGNAEAMGDLAHMYYKGDGLSQDFNLAMKWFLASANAGNLDSMSSVGALYGRGQGVEKNEKEAMQWYLRAAEGGSLPGMMNLASMYRSEKDEQSEFCDLREALKWYRKAAELQHAEAMNSLGTMYLDGKGCAQNRAQAVYWFVKAAERGHPSAMRSAAVAHSQMGHDAAVRRCYQQAAESGDADAMYELGQLLTWDIPFDSTQAAVWFKKAAELGHFRAMYQYGMMLAKGDGVAEDCAEAIKWLSEATDGGVKEAGTELRWLESEIGSLETSLRQEESPAARAALEGITEARAKSADHPDELPAQLYARARGPMAGEVRGRTEALARTSGRPWLAAITPFPAPGKACVGEYRGHESLIGSVIFLDCERVLSVSEDGRAIVWEFGKPWPMDQLIGHQGAVNHASLSPHGNWIITSGDDCTIKIWDSKTFVLAKTFEGHTEYARKAVMTAKGMIVSAGSDHTVRLWDFEKGELLKTLEGHKAWVCTLAVSPDGKRAVSVSLDSAMLLWDLETGDLLKTIVGNATYSEIEVPGVPPGGLFSGPLTVGGENVSKIGHRTYPHSAVWLEDGRLITASEEIIIWETTNFRELKRIEGDPQGVEGFALLNANRWIASVGSAIRVRDLDTGADLTSLLGHDGRDILSIAVSQDLKRAVTGDRAGTIKAWDVETVLKGDRRFGHAFSATHLHLSPGETHAATASFDKQVILWEAATGKLLFRLKNHSDNSTFVAGFRFEGRQLVTASKAEVLVWDVASGSHLRRIPRDPDPEKLKAHLANLDTCTFFDKQRLLFTGSMSYKSGLWNLEDGTVELFETPYGFYGPQVKSRDGLYVLCATYPTKLFDPKFDEVGNWIFDVCGEKENSKETEPRISPAVVWGIAERKVVAEYWPLQREVPADAAPDVRYYPTQLSWNKDETKVIVSWSTGMVCVYDRGSGGLTRSFAASAQYIGLLFWTSEKELASFGTGDDAIHFWDVSTGNEMGSVRLPRPGLERFAISSDTKLLAAAEGNTLVLLDPKEGKEISALTLPTKILEIVLGKQIFVTGADGLLYIFELRTPAIGQGRSQSNRNSG